MKGEHAPGFDAAEPHRWRQRIKRSALAAPVAGLGAVAALHMGGEARVSASAHQFDAHSVPELSLSPEQQFAGDRPPNPELFVWAESVADKYWRTLGYRPTNCERNLTVVFTDHFGGYPNPDRQPSAAIDCASHQMWINENPALAEDPWELARVVAHEYGHALGFSHSHNPDSIMYTDSQLQNSGSFDNPPPAGATVERFHDLFRTRIADAPPTP